MKFGERYNHGPRLVFRRIYQRGKMRLASRKPPRRLRVRGRDTERLVSMRPQFTPSDFLRFTRKFAPHESGCWEWTARAKKFGYGQFTVGRWWYGTAHRWTVLVAAGFDQFIKPRL